MKLFDVQIEVEDFTFRGEVGADGFGDAVEILRTFLYEHHSFYTDNFDLYGTQFENVNGSETGNCGETGVVSCYTRGVDGEKAWMKREKEGE